MRPISSLREHREVMDNKKGGEEHRGGEEKKRKGRERRPSTGIDCSLFAAREKKRGREGMKGKKGKG